MDVAVGTETAGAPPIISGAGFGGLTLSLARCRSRGRVRRAECVLSSSCGSVADTRAAPRSPWRRRQRRVGQRLRRPGSVRSASPSTAAAAEAAAGTCIAAVAAAPDITIYNRVHGRVAAPSSQRAALARGPESSHACRQDRPARAAGCTLAAAHRLALLSAPMAISSDSRTSDPGIRRLRPAEG